MQMVRVYSGALNATQILELYNDPAGPTPPSNNVTQSTPTTSTTYLVNNPTYSYDKTSTVVFNFLNNTNLKQFGVQGKNDVTN